MPGARFLQGERVALRTVEDEDAEFLRDQANHPEIRVPMTFLGPTNLTQQRDYMNGSDDGARFIVSVSGEATGYNPEYVTDEEPPVEPIGFASLCNVDKRAGSAEMAYYLTPPAQGNGYMEEALTLLLDHAFAGRRLHRVAARVIERNEASRSLLSNLGFEAEGREREGEYVRGEYEDVLRYSLLEGEWS